MPILAALATKCIWGGNVTDLPVWESFAILINRPPVSQVDSLSHTQAFPLHYSPPDEARRQILLKKTVGNIFVGNLN
jgi:hypothetical protein